MSATCTICMNPILTRDDVRVSATEVMHADCARRGGQTLVWRLRQEIAGLHEKLLEANRRNRDLEHEVGQAETATRHARRMTDAAVQTHQRVRVQLDDAIESLGRRLAAAQGELAARNSRSSGPDRAPALTHQPADDAGRVHTPLPQDVGENEKDPTEIRFSLLELT
jgi:hypothetical protein